MKGSTHVRPLVFLNIALSGPNVKRIRDPSDSAGFSAKVLTLMA